MSYQAVAINKFTEKELEEGVGIHASWHNDVLPSRQASNLPTVRSLGLHLHRRLELRHERGRRGHRLLSVSQLSLIFKIRRDCRHPTFPGRGDRQVPRIRLFSLRRPAEHDPGS